MRAINYVHILKPSVEYLERQSVLLLDSDQMAAFLGVERKTVHQLAYSDRIPVHVSLGLGKCFRWSVIELLEWVEAGCPRRTKWIEARGQSGCVPYWRTRP
jgi:predicted DNA-binding transcriptional regulator AlpA